MTPQAQKGYHDRTQQVSDPGLGSQDPAKSNRSRGTLIRWVVVACFVLYILLLNYYPLILAPLGRFLIVSHAPQRSDLIVCLAGGNVERGLSAAEAYKKGLAPRIYLTREEAPDGIEILRQKGVEYPESIDLLVKLLEALGVPKTAILVSAGPAASTEEEARMMAEIVKGKAYRSILMITSPTHSRRAYLTFRQAVEDRDVRILVMPASYSGFDPETWWTQRRHVRQVIMEYQKLIYYGLKGLL